ncbi:MAG: hypothetical protein R2874_17425 [Desulfobacterales bacterium]
MIYNIEYETMPREALEANPAKRLQAVISHVCPPCLLPEKLDDAGILPGDIKSLKDSERLSPLPPNRSAGQLPFGMFAVPIQRGFVFMRPPNHGLYRVVGYTARRQHLASHGGGTFSQPLAPAGGDIIHNAYGTAFYRRVRRSQG